MPVIIPIAEMTVPTSNNSVPYGQCKIFKKAPIVLISKPVRKMIPGTFRKYSVDISDINFMQINAYKQNKKSGEKISPLLKYFL